jgi:hypothetical protein
MVKQHHGDNNAIGPVMQCMDVTSVQIETDI